ncbi:MAG: hypothetical protein ACK5NB_11310 [Flavobacteriaceae bacterium]
MNPLKTKIKLQVEKLKNLVPQKVEQPKLSLVPIKVYQTRNKSD